MGTLPEQDRNTFDAQAVLDFVRTSADAPQQGWFSLVEEACHRLLWMEERMVTARETADRLAETVRKLRNEMLPPS